MQYATKFFAGYYIRRLIHSHPENRFASKGDNDFAKTITKNRIGNGLSIPQFLIYHVPTKEYITYKYK